MALSEVSTSKLQGLPSLQTVNHSAGSLECGSGSIPEIEALELARCFEGEFDLGSEDVRPCIATIYYQGVISGREPYAFILALELNSLGIDVITIEKALRSYSSRLDRKLSNAEITKYGRKFDFGRYDKPYGCKRHELNYFCIGAKLCPWKRQRAGFKKGPIFSTFYSLGWPAFLRDPYAVNLYLGLHHLRQLKSLPVDKEFRFNYSRIENLTGLNSHRISERLRRLNEVGLICDLAIGNAWGKGRQRTRVRLAWPIPEPKLGTQYI